MHRNNRSNRKLNRSQRRRYQDCDDDVVNIHWDKPLNQIAFELLQPISRRDSLPKNQLIAYLNCFTKYCERLWRDQSSLNEHSGRNFSTPGQQQNTNHEENEIEFEAFTDNEVLCCLRLNLFHDAAEIRAATLRAIRYYVRSKKTLHCLFELNIQHLIARSLDIVLENRIERVQALRIIRHLLVIDPSAFPLAWGRCLCSIAEDNSLEKDQLLRVCWATIAELTIVNPVVSARSGCVGVMAKCIISSAIGLSSNATSATTDILRERVHAIHAGATLSDQLSNSIALLPAALSLPYSNLVISEAIMSAFLHLYNWPDTRRLLQPKGFDLLYFISPFTDMYSFLHASNAVRNINPFNLDPINRLNEQQPIAEQKDDKASSHNRQQAAKKQQQQQQQQQQIANFESRTLLYLACKNALLSILRSWPGLFFMCRVMNTCENRKPQSTKTDAQDFLGDYLEIYRETGAKNMRQLLDSLRFFGIPEEEVKSRTSKVTQMANGIDRAMDTNCERPSSYFSTASYDQLNPLESLLAIFHLPYPEVHRHILELIYELFGIKTPEWLDNFDEAFRCVHFTLISKKKKSKDFDLASVKNQFNKSYLPDEWQLYDGFVAQEAECILPSRSNRRLNYITNYCALLLQVMIENGLFEALVSVILDSKDKAAVNVSTILLGELLHLSGNYLPANLYAHRCQSLPTLVAASISNCKSRRNRALMTISRLNQIYELKKRGPKPASLFLEQQLYFCKTKNFIPKPQKSLLAYSKNNEDSMNSLIKASLVLKRNNFKDWNWDIIVDILKHPSEPLRKLDKEMHRIFVRRLLDFFLPTRRYFSIVSKNSSMSSMLDSMSSSGISLTISLSNQSVIGRGEVIYVDNPRLMSVAATSFIEFLLDADEQRSGELLEIFVNDLDLCLKNVATKSPSSDEILIPSRLLSTLSQHYFLLIGRLAHHIIGRRLLDNVNIFQYLIQLIDLGTNEVYIKLIIASLNFNEDTKSRSLLAKVLTSASESSRLFATQYLRVLLRAHAPNFAKWVIDFLMVQLHDLCSAVSTVALDILDEACSDDDACLEKVISNRFSFLHLGDIGITFFARFASNSAGLSYLKVSNMLDKELTRWQDGFTTRYVRLIEDCLNECFSCHQRSDYGTYGRRTDRRKFPQRTSTTTYLLPHLYGQLVQTDEGIQIIRERFIVSPLIKQLKDHLDKLLVPQSNGISGNPMQQLSEATVLRVKAALWCIGHIATAERGLMHLLEFEEPIIYWITTLTKSCSILSLRATCFYVLCLISSTYKGAQLLPEFGWTAIQHTHTDIFPINQQEYDTFYLDGRPRFMSDPEKSKSMINPSSFFANVEVGVEQRSTMPRHYSHSSSSSNSSYLSIPNAISMRGDKSINPMDLKSNHHKLSSNLSSSSSSTTSIYSNTSSMGCLSSTNPVSTTVNSRPRSSSDCVPVVVHSQLEKNTNFANSRFLNSKVTPESKYNDSGILDQTSQNDEHEVKQNNRVQTAQSKVVRNRKTSAPCFSGVLLDGNRQNRSDSNDSARTMNTSSSGTGSRSTSFAEYSTSSNSSNIYGCPIDVHAAMIDHCSAISCKMPLSTPSNELNHLQLKSQLLAHTDDPYPSAIDAHGYAQLRAIQKRRVQSLSCNMFFSGLTSSSSAKEQSTVEQEKVSSKNFNRAYSNSLRSDDMPEILVTDLNASSSCSGRIRKVSRSSLPPISPIEDFRPPTPVLNIRNASSFEESPIHSELAPLFKSTQRSFSRISKNSFLSNDSLGPSGLDEVSYFEDTQFQNDKTSEKTQFMCLCLPVNLSLIFSLDEDCVLASKTKKVQFTTDSEYAEEQLSNETQLNRDPESASQLPTIASPLLNSQLISLEETKQFLDDGLELHSNIKCMACCIIPNIGCRSIESNNLNTPISFNAKNSDFDSENDASQTSQILDIATGDRSMKNGHLAQFSRESRGPVHSIVQRKEVLRLVTNMSTAMFAKQGEQGLLSLKQRFPSVFEDLCLYSEICLQMELRSFCETSRRFLHELFLDVNINQLYDDVQAIFRKKQITKAPSVTAEN